MVDLAVLGLLLDSMILKVFSNLNDSMILWFYNIHNSDMSETEEESPICKKNNKTA